jgi:DNA-binding CsgD family transcriptional regulator
MGVTMNGDLALHIHSPLLPFTRFHLKTGTFILGRSSTCEFVVKHVTVSRRHAEISVDSGCITVCDLASHNGTYVDEKRILKSRVTEGHRIRFGSIVFLLTDSSSNDQEPGSDMATSKFGVLARSDGLETLEFSKAQRRVLNLLLEGLAEKKIAGRLHLSLHTVHNHIQAIYRIVNVHSRAEFLADLLRKNAGPYQVLS